MSGLHLGIAESHQERGDNRSMLESAKKALRWASNLNSAIGARVLCAQAELLAGQTDAARTHVLEALACLDEDPSICEYPELQDLLAELRKLEKKLLVDRQG